LRAGSEPECGRALELTPEIHVQSGVHYVAQVFHASRLRLPTSQVGELTGRRATVLSCAGVHFTFLGR